MNKEPIEKEFNDDPTSFTKHEMASEARLLNIAYKGNKEKLRERYLNAKKIVNLDSNGNVRAVVAGRQQDYVKYDRILRTWQIANLPGRESIKQFNT